MPYVTKEARDYVRDHVPTNAGELCYQLTMGVLAKSDYAATRRYALQCFEQYVESRRLGSWQNFCDCMGATMGMAGEVKRQGFMETHQEQAKAVGDALGQYYKDVIAPYEDKKIAENGNVFPGR